ncbi:MULTISPECIES: ROK family protein [Micrococcales]|uniref:ROK family protein n=1 Tax=Micrococcales TaxID=85006 RepID=UPI0004AAF62C|nr:MULTISPECIES: ROK family protein [Micrococcales]
MTRAAVALDLGGTKTAGALVTSTGEILDRAAEPTPAAQGPEAVLATAASVSRQLLEKAAAQGIEVRPILGIGSAGVINPNTGQVVSATPNISGWAGTLLADELAARLADVPGRPIRTVRPVNDVHAHGLGEHMFRLNNGEDASGTTILVAFGTGVGGAVLIDGKPQVGRHFVAGHVGMMPAPHHPEIEIFAPTAEDPEHLILEDACGGVSLPGAYRTAGGAREVATTRDLFEQAADDPTAQRVIRVSAEIAGSFLAGLVNAIDPDRLVLSGGLADSGPLWWEPMLRVYEHVRLPGIETVPAPASSGGLAALLGAASLAWADDNPADTHH